MKPSPPYLSKGENTRQNILSVAYELFLEQGFHATSMRQIAHRAGIAVSGIYNHFPGKEAIFDELIVEKHPYKQVIPILQAAPGDTIEAFAHNAAVSMLAELNHRPDFLKLIFIEITEFKGSHIPLLSQAVFPQVAPLLERFNRLENRLEDRLEDRPDNRPKDRLRDIPLPLIIRSFIGLIFSHYLIQYVAGTAHVSWIEGGDDVVAQIVDIFLHGVLKPV